MRGSFWLLLTLLACTSIAFADTTWVAGGTVSGSWTAAHSPFVIQGHINVSTGDSLLIGPGVRVYFAGPYYLQVDSAGFFNALGAEDDSVVFTTDTLQNPQRWGGLQICDALDTVRLAYCVVEYAGGATGEGSTISRCPLRLSHSTLRHNLSADWGGALSLGDVDAWIAQCRFHDNASDRGGACYSDSWNQHVTFAGCVFENNTATSEGGALALATDAFTPALSQARLETCVFRGNRAMNPGGVGGAVHFDHMNAWVVNCEFRENAAVRGGAVGSIGTDTVRFNDSRFVANSAQLSGGAIVANGVETCLSHCLMDSNQAQQGGALFHDSGNLTVLNGTLLHNHASVAGGTVVFGTAPASQNFWNNILAGTSGAAALAQTPQLGMGFNHNLFWNNAAGDVDATHGAFGVITTVNDNGDSCDAAGNLFRDPQFANTAAGDYRLTAASPCIDAGFSNPYYVPFDPDSTLPDIGAFYYYQSLDAADPLILHPSAFVLSAHPNPFNAVTTLTFNVAHGGAVSLKLYNLLGEQVATLVDGTIQPGRYRATWNAEAFSSGTYLAVLQTGRQRFVQKLLLLK